jgi:hypothetical protein
MKNKTLNPQLSLQHRSDSVRTGEHTIAYSGTVEKGMLTVTNVPGREPIVTTDRTFIEVLSRLPVFSMSLLNWLSRWE